MMKCPSCQNKERQVKAGKTASGSHRYQCQACRRRYAPKPKVQGYPVEVRQQALRLYVDGINYRRIARILKVNHKSVMN